MDHRVEEARQGEGVRNGRRGLIWGPSMVGLVHRICPQCSIVAAWGALRGAWSPPARENNCAWMARAGLRALLLPSSSLLSYLATATSVFPVSPIAPLKQHQLHWAFSRQPTLRCFWHRIFRKQKERGPTHEKRLLVGGRSTVLVYTWHTALVWGYEVTTSSRQLLGSNAP